MGKRVSRKSRFVISVFLLLTAIGLFVAVTYSWYINNRQLSTATWIKTPIVLTIGSGKNHDIKYLDMGDIDVATGSSKDYVICVYGTPIDNYSLQLAYTTNIAFHYEIYRASETTDMVNGVSSSYIDANGVKQTEYFKKTNATDAPVLTGYTLAEITKKGDTAAAHQSHSMSYGDDKGQNAIDKSMVQSNAEPLYWLAEENNTNVLRPVNQSVTDDGTPCFLDYYIIHVTWDSNVVKNNKETDIVYLTVSR